MARPRTTPDNGLTGDQAPSPQASAASRPPARFRDNPDAHYLAFGRKGPPASPAAVPAPELDFLSKLGTSSRETRDPGRKSPPWSGLCSTGIVEHKERRPGAGRHGRHGKGTAKPLTAQRTEEVRHRVRLMIEITARAGSYRKGLLAAAAHLSPEEAAIIADLERHGLQVPQLHDVLCGGHVLVDDPQLYEDWRFAKVSHLRVSSHHKDIDKTRYPTSGC